MSKTTDASFQDGREAPLNLGAQNDEELRILSALVQDAVFPITEMKWLAKQHRFVILLNRFRWEEGARMDTAPERVQSLLAIDCVVSVASQGIDRSRKDVILSLLSISFEAGEDGTGVMHLTLAGDAVIRLHVEAIEMRLKDVTRPYKAPSGHAPHHPD